MREIEKSDKVYDFFFVFVDTYYRVYNKRAVHGTPKTSKISRVHVYFRVITYSIKMGARNLKNPQKLKGARLF